jgi:hypothetical protein
MDSIVEHDAREFGAHLRMKGWRLGLLVARCVEHGKPGPSSAPAEQNSKVSINAFATSAGVGRNTLSAYLAAWDRAARQGVVPPRSELRPGADPELDWDELPFWEIYYRPPGRSNRFAPHAADSQSHEDESEINLYYTPEVIISAARELMGGIDLDPATDRQANTHVGATKTFTLGSRPGALARDWHGRVLLNPPYNPAGTAGGFVRHLVEQYKHGNVTAAVVVLNGYSFDANWFNVLFRYQICFTRASTGVRQQFRRPNDLPQTQPNVGPVIIYLGPGLASGRSRNDRAAKGPLGLLARPFGANRLR